MKLLQVLQAEVEDYLDRYGMKPTAFGKAAVGDPNFVFDLRAGREPRTGTVDRVRAFMTIQGKDAA